MKVLCGDTPDMEVLTRGLCDHSLMNKVEVGPVRSSNIILVRV